MSNKTPVIVALLFILSIMGWKLVNNYQEIKLVKEKQNYKSSIQPLDHDEKLSTESESVNTQNQVKKDHSNLERNPNPSSLEKAKGVVANPIEPLEDGFEWTDEYYDPDQLEEPGYREKVMEHLRAKHYYKSPQRQMPAFRQSQTLLDQWNVDSNLENTVLLHDTAVEWHRNLYYAERESGPAAGPDARERVAFMTEFKKKSIRDRFKDLFGIDDKEFMDAFTKIKPDRPILGPKLVIEPGERLMRVVE